ncbi:MAG: lamin tail domain-containing protein, partial [Myxococcales bacterium]|nr:lamin tail domain-containing protein [Myxococcales bacterium]
ILDEVFAAGVTGGTYEEDWVELYNPNPDPVDVSGWHCTDDPTMPMKGVFPADTIVPAMGYLQFAVTDASVGFKLAQGGESFTFFDAADVMVDTVTYGDGEAGTDTNVVSYARIPDLTGAFQTTATVTPGAANPATP